MILATACFVIPTVLALRCLYSKVRVCCHDASEYLLDPQVAARDSSVPFALALWSPLEVIVGCYMDGVNTLCACSCFADRLFFFAAREDVSEDVIEVRVIPKYLCVFV
jgi:hypothetical protein